MVNGLGVFEGVFDPAGYLHLHPDVADAGVDAWRHYREFGYAEGRATALQDTETVTLFMDTFEEMTVEPSIDSSSLSPQDAVSSDEDDDGDDSDDSDDD